MKQKRTNICLDEDRAAYLASFGGGNLSLGIRVMHDVMKQLGTEKLKKLIEKAKKK